MGDSNREAGETGNDRKLGEILRGVNRLLHIAEIHPVVLKPEGVYLGELYVRAINENARNLRFLRYRGEQIPYVLVHSSEIEDMVGKPFNHLYFVARDLAPELWQQKIIAYHESRCVVRGHDYAKAQEVALARSLKVEKEYRRWRARIDAQFKCHDPR